MAKKKHYRFDLFQWRRDQTGDSYGKLAKKSQLAKNTTCAVVKGRTDPTATTINAICKAMDLDPKFAFDFKLHPSQFHRAVLSGDSGSVR